MRPEHSHRQGGPGVDRFALAALGLCLEIADRLAFITMAYD